MRVGIPTEIKNNEYRVAITPGRCRRADPPRPRGDHPGRRRRGLGDLRRRLQGAPAPRSINSADEVWAEADLLLKVKEPIEPEYSRMRKGQTLFTYLHLAASKPCTDALMASGTTSIAYETVQTADGALPLLAPMSEVAGRLSAQVGAYHLMRTQGGRGVLMGGVPGVAPAEVVVIGGGMAGYNAAAVAKGMGAHVTVFDLNINTLRKIDAEYGGAIETRYSSTLDLEDAVKRGRPGDRRRAGARRQGAQAGHEFDCRTDEAGRGAGRHRDRPGWLLRGLAARPRTTTPPSRCTTRVFYCVANMPGAVPRTSTYALTNATMPYVVKLADRAGSAACQADPALAKGLSTHEGALLSEQVAADLDLPFTDPAPLLA